MFIVTEYAALNEGTFAQSSSVRDKREILK